MYNKIYFKNKFLRYMLPFLFVCLFVYVFISRCQLKRNFEITNAKVKTVGERMSKSGDWLIEFEYKTKDGVLYSNSSYWPVFLNKKRELEGKYIPYAYYTKNPKRGELLITRQIWKQYKLSFPGSLSWVEKYFDVKKIIYSY